MRHKLPKTGIEINVDRPPSNCWTIGQVTRGVVAALGLTRYAPANSRAFVIPDGRELIVAIGKGQTLEKSIEQAMRQPKRPLRAITIRASGE